MSGLLPCPILVTATTGVITLKQLHIKEELIFPAGATHVFMKGAWATVDFTSGHTECVTSPDVILSRNAPLQDVVLVPPAAPAGNSMTLFLVRIGFSQLVNGTFYRFGDGSSNALGIVSVK